MTKMAAMPIYGKNPSKIFSETNRLISRKLGVKHRWLKYSNVYINHDPVMTLTSLWHMQQISGERLQDHWSSGLSELIGNPNCWFSHTEAHIVCQTNMVCSKML